MEKKKGYTGSIRNQGAQVVKAPVSQGKQSGKSVIHRGNDLRTGGK